MGIGWGYDYWHHSDYSIPTRRLITILLTLHLTNVVAFSRNNKWKTSIFRRYRSEWFTPWLMLTTTRWTRDLHPLHRWSISSKMTSSCLIDVEGDTASQHMGRRQVSIQTTSTVVASLAQLQVRKLPRMDCWTITIAQPILKDCKWS